MRGDPQCWRRVGNLYCGRPLSEHVGDKLACPQAGGNPRRTYHPHAAAMHRASCSLSLQDARALSELVRRELSSGSVWARSNAQALGRLGGIAQSLQRRIAAQAGAQDDGDAKAAE